ncbi:MAG TPA: hypothetical protein VJ508_12990, partial [Saprospiraceae bacterium]|nr:hypothetical protein [Saprospiraceae bacterium]
DSRKKGQFIRGRILAASYVNFANDNAYDVQRMRYTLTMNTRQPTDRGFGAETYISFRHTINEWQDVKDNFKQAMKIYSLAVGYQFAPGTQVWLGRKINTSISNLGAIDGVQLEKRWHTLTTGFFFGSRPDYEDYGFNFHLLQVGTYLAHDLETRNGQVLSTLAFAEQQNNHHTDRRYIYIQHSNSAIKNINLFGSAEIDLYTLSNLQPKDTFNLTSIYFSIRYRVSRALSLFASYDARKNIIYYESYKNFIDQLLEDETRQGLRFSFNYHLLKKVTLGSSAGLRFERNNPKPSQNVYSYVTVSRITPLHLSATASAVLLRTSYLKGNIFGLRLSRDFFKGKLNTEAEYRNVVYRYGSTEYPIRQSIVGLNASIRINRKLSIAINYEGEIQSTMTLHRIYSSIVNRF